jgi:hypothetical protein
LLTGHGGGEAYDTEKMQGWTEWMDRWQALFTDITTASHADRTMDPHWIEFRPYKIRIRPGDEVCFRLYVKNHSAEQEACSLRFRSVSGVALDRVERAFLVEAGQTQEVEVRARFPAVFVTHSLPVLADVTWGGKRLGEVAEAIAYW